MSDFERELADHTEVARQTAAAVRDTFPRLVDACWTAMQNGRMLLFFGNGGSAADAQHFAAELVVRYRHNRAAIRALALTTDSSVLTATGNDFGFADVFARQVEAICQPGDVVIAISTSGNSENVVRGLRIARALGATTAVLTGGTGGTARSLADHAIVVPSTTTARIQEMHLLLGHTLCGLLEARLTCASEDQQADRSDHGATNVRNEIVAIGGPI